MVRATLQRVAFFVAWREQREQRDDDRDEDSGGPTAWRRVALSDELDIDGAALIEFSARVLAGGLAHTSARRWGTTARSLEPLLPHAVVTARWRRNSTALLELDSLFGSDCLAYVWLGGESAFARVAARDLPVVAEAESWLREHLPKAEPKADQSAPVTFWPISGRGGHSISRTIRVPSWEEIRPNYPAPSGHRSTS
jgi:hypothetical protein